MSSTDTDRAWEALLRSPGGWGPKEWSRVAKLVFAVWIILTGTLAVSMQLWWLALVSATAFVCGGLLMSAAVAMLVSTRTCDACGKFKCEAVPLCSDDGDGVRLHDRVYIDYVAMLDILNVGCPHCESKSIGFDLVRWSCQTCGFEWPPLEEGLPGDSG